jgi:hypothetical protein
VKNYSLAGGGVAGRGSADLKEWMASESVGDAEPTSKGDLPLSPDGISLFWVISDDRFNVLD